MTYTLYVCPLHEELQRTAEPWNDGMWHKEGHSTSCVGCIKDWEAEKLRYKERLTMKQLNYRYPASNMLESLVLAKADGWELLLHSSALGRK